MYKYVVFDLDGTLVNSLFDLADSVNKALEKNGLPAHPYDAYKYFVGNGRAKLIERAMGDASKDEELKAKVTKDYDDDYIIHCLDKTKPYDGIVEMLKSLKQNGIKINVLSNKPDEFVKNMNENQGFIKTMWCGNVECENKIKELTSAKSRCLPFKQEHLSDTCVCCGKKADKMVVWGRQY